MSKEGKVLESSVEQSCSDQMVFYFRVRDVFLPPDVRLRVKLPQNKYDALLFYNQHLFPVEMKSTKDNKISFSESMIKANQIRNLKEATKYPNVIPGFIFNFRENENKTFFIHIDKFLEYKNIAENKLEHTYKSKVNRASIPIGICEEIGIEIVNVKKVKNFRYYINKLCDELIENHK